MAVQGISTTLVFLLFFFSFTISSGNAVKEFAAKPKSN
jgi:hypothetical protein